MKLRNYSSDDIKKIHDDDRIIPYKNIIQSIYKMNNVRLTDREIFEINKIKYNLYISFPL